MQESFFDDLEIDAPLKNKKEPSCIDCKLYTGCKSSKMQASGKGRKKILIIGEAPGRVEDEENTQFVGDSGQFLRQSLEKFGLFLDRDFVKINAINCRPPKNRTPYTKEVNACRKNVYKVIEEYKPKAILPMGSVALQSLLGPRITGRIEKVSFSDWVGETIPDQELKTWVCPLFHPSHIMRNDENEVLQRIWMEQLQRAVSVIHRSFYEHNYQSDVFILTDVQEVITLLDRFMKESQCVSFDYETTGKKPHRRGHRILSVSVSDGMFAWSFPFFDDKQFRQKWREFLLCEKLKKIVHYESYERLWSQTIAGQDIQGFVFDTALAQHIIRNNKNKQLKFWSYIHFGILGYDDRLHDYITRLKEGEDPKSANAFNCLDESPEIDLLQYGGLDSLLTFKLHEQQKTAMDTPDYKRAYDLFIEGNKYLVKCQQNGIRLDVEKMEQQKKEIKERLKQLHNKIMDSKEVKQWDGKKPFDYAPNKKDIPHLLFDILKIKPVLFTNKTGKPAINKEALEKINIPLTKKILEYRRWDKALNTYIAQYSREHIDGILHPFFHLSTVTTYRSSSSNPNFQNVPKRDKEIKNILRSLIIPRKGNRLVSWDFKQMEVCVSACYNKDPNLIAYINDTTKDMHRDMAALLFLNEKEKITKEERQEGKNKFVFPEFYGSYFEQVAPDIWENMPKYTKERLRNNGIKNLYDFTEHVQSVENYLWQDLFPVYAEWKIKFYRDYLQKGYVDFYTGFRCYGPLKRNEAVNYPIQGSAFHILLWTLIKVMKKMDHVKRSFIIGQIHDDIEGDVYPDDEEEFDYYVWLYATKKVREHWDWINVPLRVEKERSEIDDNWAEMSDCGFLDFEKGKK